MRKKCTKSGYVTRSDAERAISAMAAKYGSITFKRPYWCGPCRGYHVTSTPSKGRRKQW
jgi:hypothetical protein